ncbi:response regulator transcription factor [Marinitoga litoralis]|uniref:response regulator transcription factor n=1 Tax=Marinitoga litoralis TaxID=570855 RepID=UPI001961BD55|nr:response regulator transcription factor [Marinitoga litoralis]MBM7560211.1 DNA-binding response OmpR family regulator [Marinitoga litoralis]
MKILIIEDEESIRDLIRMNLILENFEVIVAENGNEGVELFKKESPELVILDLMLPDKDGFEVLKELQSINYKIPIIILTAKNNQNDKLLGLELGADDYITKPFDSKELILRIRNIIRRMKKSNITLNKNIVGSMYLDKNARKFFVKDKEVYLTKKEFELMELLINNHKQVLSRDVLLEKIWGYEENIDTRALDMTIQRLRKKMGECGKYIKSIYGIGYILEVPNEE